MKYEALTDNHAKQALIQFGPNRLNEAPPESIVHKIVKHVRELPSLVLLFALILSFYMVLAGHGQWLEVIVIAGVLLLNIGLGMYQEHAAAVSLASLQEFSIQEVLVLRRATADAMPQTIKISAENIVPGDILSLKAGDKISADAVLVKAENFNVDESILTGESEPVTKAVTDDIYSGTHIVSGSALAKVTATGMSTQIGNIAESLSENTVQETNLNKKMNQLIRYLSVIALISGIAIVVLLQIYQESFTEALLAGIALAVAAVPETLPVIVTISFAVGITRIARRQALVTRVSAVETVGNIDIICSDKTGTLTQNKMTIVNFWTVSDGNISLQNDLSQNSALQYLLLNTDAVFQDEQILGDATEQSILKLAAEHHLKRQDLEITYPRIAELPFDSAHKYMVTIHQLNDEENLLLVKGAPESVPLRQNILPEQLINEWSRQGQRILALSARHIPRDSDWRDYLQGLPLTAMIGIMDPPKSGVAEAIQQFHQAGIRTIMITGDHVKTAIAIAKQLHIYRSGDLALTGQDISDLSDQALSQRLTKATVFARVTPQDKIRLVRLLQERGHTVAMTGDGVNDAPALKQANVGIAMEQTGTDVAKEASDVILMDDNFTTIVPAIAGGRGIHNNIMKATEFLVGVNFAQILLMLIMTFITQSPLLTATQLLVINILADGIPGFFLAYEQPEKNILDAPPLRNQSVFGGGLGHRLAFRATAYTFILLILYVITDMLGYSLAVSQTMSFLVLGLGSIIDIYAIKTRAPLTLSAIARNIRLNIAVIVAVIIMIATAIIPILREALSLTTLDGQAWVICTIAIFLPLVLLETRKRWVLAAHTR